MAQRKKRTRLYGWILVIVMVVVVFAFYYPTWQPSTLGFLRGSKPLGVRVGSVTMTGGHGATITFDRVDRRYWFDAPAETLIAGAEPELSRRGFVLTDRIDDCPVWTHTLRPDEEVMIIDYPKEGGSVVSHNRNAGTSDKLQAWLWQLTH